MIQGTFLLGLLEALGWFRVRGGDAGPDTNTLGTNAK